MGRLVILIGACLIIIGALITFNIPLNWVGHLPGDLSLKWGNTRVFIPLTTAVIVSFVLLILFFAFLKR